MKIAEPLQNFINKLESQDFYKYLFATLALVFFLIFGIIFQFYRSKSTLLEKIDTINEQREITQRILGKYQHVKKQQKDVDAMLAQNEGFKIGGYFKTLLTELNLKDNKTVGDHSHIDHRNNYRENILRTKLVDMNMKQVCELLYELEKTKRIYTKELSVSKSKKKHKKVDIALTIATLEPRQTFT